MNTFGLGRKVDTFWLGLPYAEVEEVFELPDTHGGGMWPGIGDKKKKRDEEQNKIIMAVIKEFLEREG